MPSARMACSLLKYPRIGARLKKLLSDADKVSYGQNRAAIRAFA